jgi:hypothetical protein
MYICVAGCKQDVMWGRGRGGGGETAAQSRGRMNKKYRPARTAANVPSNSNALASRDKK